MAIFIRNAVLLFCLFLIPTISLNAQGTDSNKPGDKFKDCDQCPEMIVVPAGSFMMGSPSNEEGRSDREGPQHMVTIPRDFAVGRFEVTFNEWGTCVAGGGCYGYQPNDEGWGRGKRPTINVSWDDAKAYVSWLSRNTGKPYRLLSEAEWEYAARAGTTTRYSWGNAASHEYANYGVEECCGGLASGSDRWKDETAPAGSFPSNAFGLHDMHGNVWEWIEDCWNGSYASAPSDGAARKGGYCDRRVLRGGSWSYTSSHLRSANRYYYFNGFRKISNGFRVARTLN
jgi:formylglycine-generating enzyme required for sulfatase activity